MQLYRDVLDTASFRDSTLERFVDYDQNVLSGKEPRCGAETFMRVCRGLKDTKYEEKVISILNTIAINIKHKVDYDFSEDPDDFLCYDFDYLLLCLETLEYLRKK